MKLLIVGDSFCETRENHPISWLYHLKYSHGHVIHGKGFPGQSWWHQRRWLMKNFQQLMSEKYDAMVVIHPHKNRLHSTLGSKINYPTVTQGPRDNEPSNHRLAREIYESEFFDIEFQSWAIKRWITSLWRADFRNLFKTKLIQLPGSCDGQTFVELKDLLEPIGDKVCYTSTTALVDISINEKEFVQLDGDARINHFNEHNNRCLADFVNKLLVSDSGDHDILDQPWDLKKPIQR